MTGSFALIGSVYDCDSFEERYDTEVDAYHDYEGLHGQSFTRWAMVVDCTTGEALHCYQGQVDEDEDEEEEE